MVDGCEQRVVTEQTKLSKSFCEPNARRSQVKMLEPRRNVPSVEVFPVRHEDEKV